MTGGEITATNAASSVSVPAECAIEQVSVDPDGGVAYDQFSYW